MGQYCLWTDGALRKDNIGAYAFAIVKNNDTLLAEHSELVRETTNNRMELMGVIEGLKKFDPKTATVEVISDSAYVVNCFKQKWYVKWRKNGWQNSSHEEVKNKDLWQELLEIVEKFSDRLSWSHVKGHSGHKWNEYVDSLCDKCYEEV